MIQRTVKTRVVGIGLSIDETVYAIVDVRGNIIAKDTFATTDFVNVNDFVTYLSEKVVEMIENNGGYECIRSVGVSSPSANFLTGCIENAPNLPWKGQIPLAAMLQDRLGLAVALGNDAHVRALGEYVFGSAHGMKDFIVVNLGHGVGSCIFTKGKAHLGSEGEILDSDPRPSLMRDRRDMTPADITAFADEGDVLAQEVYRRAGHQLGIGLANYASILNPEGIILAGGISHAGHWLLDAVNDSFEEHVFHNVRGKVKLLSSNLDQAERDVLGASALAWDVKEYSLFV